jgi:antirestriction protein ArdC
MRDSRAEAAFLHIIDTSRLLTVLKNDTRAIFTAAGHAQKAVDFLKSLQPPAEEPAARLAA